MLSEIDSFREIYIACGKTDLRKGIDGLACLFKEKFGLDPFREDVLFLFCLDKEREDLIVSGVWIHCRRGFAEVVKILPGEKKKGSVAYKVLQLIRTICHYENRLKDLTPEERLEERKNSVAPLMICSHGQRNCLTNAESLRQRSSTTEKSFNKATRDRVASLTHHVSGGAFTSRQWRSIYITSVVKHLRCSLHY